MRSFLAVVLGIGISAQAFGQLVPEYVHIDFSRLPDGSPTKEGMELSDQFAAYGVWFSLDDGLGLPIIVQEGDPVRGFIGNGGGHDFPMSFSGGSFGLTDPVGPKEDFASFRPIRIDFGAIPSRELRLRSTRISGVMPDFQIYFEDQLRCCLCSGSVHAPCGNCVGPNGGRILVPRSLESPDAVWPATSIVTGLGTSGLPNGYALFDLDIARGPQAGLSGPYVRVAQESEPSAGDYDQNVLGFLRPRRSPLELRPMIGDFYQYGLGDATSFNGNHRLLSLMKERSHIAFIESAEGLTLVVVHSVPRSCTIGDGGPPGTAEMRIDFDGLAGPIDITIKDDPSDFYELTPNQSSLKIVSTWGQDESDGLAISGFEGDWSAIISFTELDGNSSTHPFENGLLSWVATTTDGPPIDLILQTDLRVQLKAVCLADTNDNCRVDLGDFPSFSDCIHGPHQPVPPHCELFDVHPDHDVDLRDFARFETAFNGL